MADSFMLVWVEAETPILALPVRGNEGVRVGGKGADC